MWKEACREDSFRKQKSVELGGHRYALFRLDDGIYCLDDICSHEFSLLSEGEIWDTDVYCPKHGSRFDIRTGSVKSFPATQPVKTYPVKVEEGLVFIDTGDS